MFVCVLSYLVSFTSNQYESAFDSKWPQRFVRMNCKIQPFSLLEQKFSLRGESDPRPSVYKTDALTTELCSRLESNEGRDRSGGSEWSRSVAFSIPLYFGVVEGSYDTSAPNQAEALKFSLRVPSPRS